MREARQQLEEFRQRQGAGSDEDEELGGSGKRSTPAALRTRKRRQAKQGERLESAAVDNISQLRLACIHPQVGCPGSEAKRLHIHELPEPSAQVCYLQVARPTFCCLFRALMTNHASVILQPQPSSTSPAVTILGPAQVSQRRRPLTILRWLPFRRPCAAHTHVAGDAGGRAAGRRRHPVHGGNHAAPGGERAERPAGAPRAARAPHPGAARVPGLHANRLWFGLAPSARPALTIRSATRRRRRSATCAPT